MQACGLHPFFHYNVIHRVEAKGWRLGVLFGLIWNNADSSEQSIMLDTLEKAETGLKLRSGRSTLLV